MLQAKHKHYCFTLTKYFKHLVKVLKMLSSTSTQVLDPCLNWYSTVNKHAMQVRDFLKMELYD